MPVKFRIGLLLSHTEGQSDLGLHCLLRNLCPEARDRVAMVQNVEVLLPIGSANDRKTLLARKETFIFCAYAQDTVNTKRLSGTGRPFVL